MADIIDTLHPKNNPDDNIYPNIKPENIPDGSITARKLVSDIMSGSPKFVGTTAQINALEVDEGIAVSVDNNHWFYWNGSSYVDSGLAYTSDVYNVYGRHKIDFFGSTGMGVTDSGVVEFLPQARSRLVDINWYRLEKDDVVILSDSRYRYWLAVKSSLDQTTITDTGWMTGNYVATSTVYVRIIAGKPDGSDFSDSEITTARESIKIFRKEPIGMRLGSCENDGSYKITDSNNNVIFMNRLRTPVLRGYKGQLLSYDLANYDMNVMIWVDGVLKIDTGWLLGSTYVIPYDCDYVVILKKSVVNISLLTKGRLYYGRNPVYAVTGNRSVMTVDPKYFKAGETISKIYNAYGFQTFIDFIPNKYGLTAINPVFTMGYKITSMTIPDDISKVKDVVVTFKKYDDSAFTKEELLNQLLKTVNVTGSDVFDSESVYDYLFSIDSPVELNRIDSNILQFAHRGYELLAPENTMPSLELAVRNGLRILEVDVRFTSEGIPVLLHDATINRTARNNDGSQIAGTMAVSELTYPQLLGYDFGSWKSSLYKGTRIPTLDQALRFAKDHNCFIHLDVTTIPEIGDNQIDAVYDVIKKYDMKDYILLESLSRHALEHAISLGIPPENTMLNFYTGFTRENIDSIAELGCRYCSISDTLVNQDLITYSIAKGLKVLIWSTSGISRYNQWKFIEMGVTGFYVSDTVIENVVRNIGLEIV